MRRNRRRVSFNEETETRRMIYISIGVVIIAIITFVITYFIYSNAISKKTIGDISSIKELSNIQNEQSSQVSSSIGKTVNEVTKEENDNQANKIAINTSNLETLNEETNKIEDTINTASHKAVESQDSKQEEKIPDPTFIKPVEGDILREYAIDNLVYSETLKEWITHTGIDIKADKTTIVKASADGIVKYIKNDPRYGITVIIEHANGFTSIYSNLLTAEFVKEGEEIKQGQTIGTVGNTATFEILDESHLHFEILKDNEYLNPSDYIK